MAAEGRSNPEIAQALFITKKTVESHLASVYRKLEIRSRNQLEFALRETRARRVRHRRAVAASAFDG
jgi:DNA-binding CsgD family transcriptional regulator